MLTTIEAEVDVDGNVRLLEPLTITKKSRAIVTLLDDDSVIKQSANDKSSGGKTRGGIRELFGSASLGHPTGADNEGIDADLAAEYANNHDE
jgi:hypothetical protein